MFFISILFALTVAVWAALAVRTWNKARLNFPYALAGLAILVAGSVLGYDFFHVPAPIPITSERAMLATLVAIFGLMVLRKRQSLQPILGSDLILFALLGVILASAFTNDYSYNNNLPISRSLFFYLMPLALYFVVRNSSLESWEPKLFLIGLTLFGCYLAATAVFEVKGIHALVFPKFIVNSSVQEFLGRGRGPFLNPISNGLFLTTSLAAAVVLFWQSSNKHKFILGPLLVLLAIGNIATLTRSVWLGMALGVGIVVWIVTNRQQRAIAIIASTVAMLVLVAAKGDSLVNFKRDKFVTQNEMSQSALLRPIFATVAWEMFKDKPLLGCGFGQYNREKLQYLRMANSDLPLTKAKPYLQHNVFLSLLTEVGFVGCSLLIAFLLNSLYLASRLIRDKDVDVNSKMFALMTVACVLSYIANGMFHDTSIIPMAHLLLFLLVGITTRMYQLSLKGASEESFSPSSTERGVLATGLTQA